MSEKPLLFSFFRSSASWRVRIALAYKGIEYDYEGVNLFTFANRSEEFKKKNPTGQVPTLVIDGVLLTQSLPIIEYLEETRPQGALLPKDPIQRAQVRRIAEIINAGIQPFQNIVSVGAKLVEFTGKEQHKQAWGHYWIDRGLEALERVLESTAGTYCVGDSISIADVCLVPQIANAKVFNVDLTKFPIITRIGAKCEEHVAFKAAHPSRQPDFDEAIATTAPP